MNSSTTRRPLSSVSKILPSDAATAIKTGSFAPASPSSKTERSTSPCVRTFPEVNHARKKREFRYQNLPRGLPLDLRQLGHGADTFSIYVLVWWRRFRGPSVTEMVTFLSHFVRIISAPANASCGLGLTIRRATTWA